MYDESERRKVEEKGTCWWKSKTSGGGVRSVEVGRRTRKIGRAEVGKGGKKEREGRGGENTQGKREREERRDSERVLIFCFSVFVYVDEIGRAHV